MARPDLRRCLPLLAERDRPWPGQRVPPQPRAAARKPAVVVPHGIRGGLTMPQTIGDLAVLVRSKNAGPFWLTFDIMFDDPAVYRRVRDSEVINRNAVAAMFRRDP